MVLMSWWWRDSFFTENFSYRVPGHETMALHPPAATVAEAIAKADLRDDDEDEGEEEEQREKNAAAQSSPLAEDGRCCIRSALRRCDALIRFLSF
jgi:hypothetical protein